MQRLNAAKPRIESLNPLVTVETITDVMTLDGDRFESIVKSVDLVCITDWDRDGLVSSLHIFNIRHLVHSLFQIRINNLCRKFQKPFYAGGTYGLTGYIFCDLLSHEYLAP